MQRDFTQQAVKARRGVSLSSYGLIVGLISIVALTAVQSIGERNEDLFESVSDSLDGAITGSGTSGSAGGATSPEANSCFSNPQPGDLCADDTIYAGLSPDTGTAMYATRCDAGQSFNSGSGFCECDGAIIHPATQLVGDANTATSGTAIQQYGVNFTIQRSGIPYSGGFDGWLSVGVTDTVTGQANTTALLSLDSETNPGTQPHLAAEYCDGLVQHGHSDWYLPARDEMVQIAQNQNAGAFAGNFDLSNAYPAGYYRTSSENNFSTAHNVRVGNGTVDTLRGKTWLMPVRCVRTD
ncbi:MAG: hypothetical protein Alpg2KO_18070 [Alphaproteobacteria bacterium]